jgi:PhoPQ-activated pathogenicity-related protein
MPLFEINTVSLFRHKYIIHAKNLEHACDAILIDDPEALTQRYLDETITDSRKIDRKEFEKLCQQSIEDSNEWSNAHLGTKIIHKVNYNES